MDLEESTQPAKGSLLSLVSPFLLLGFSFYRTLSVFAAGKWGAVPIGNQVTGVIGVHWEGKEKSDLGQSQQCDSSEFFAASSSWKKLGKLQLIRSPKREKQEKWPLKPIMAWQS